MTLSRKDGQHRGRYQVADGAAGADPGTDERTGDGIGRAIDDFEVRFRQDLPPGGDELRVGRGSRRNEETAESQEFGATVVHLERVYVVLAHDEVEPDVRAVFLLQLLERIDRPGFAG